MPYSALAFDYDGTVARHGVIDEGTLAALERWRQSGRLLILVTGRILPAIQRIFPALDSCAVAVVENGAVLFWPSSQRQELLAEPPASELIGELRDRGLSPMFVGRVLIGTWEPAVPALRATMKELKLDWQVIMNKGSVMVLPRGVDKRSGLLAALERLGLDPATVVGIGDAENDLAFLRECGLSAAVGNALEEVKQAVDVVLEQTHGAGVVALIDRLLAPVPPPGT